MEQLFPTLTKEAARAERKARKTAGFWFKWIRVFLTLVIMGLILALIVLVISSAQAAEAGELWDKLTGAEGALKQASTLESKAQELKQREAELQRQQAEQATQGALAQQRDAYEARLAELNVRQSQTQAEYEAQLAAIAKQQEAQGYEQQLAAVAEKELQTARQNSDLRGQLAEAQYQARQAEVETTKTGKPTTKAYGYADPVSGAVSSGVIETQPQMIARMPDGGLGLGPQDTHITIVPPEQVIQHVSGVAKIRNETSGTDHRNSIELPADVTDEKQMELLTAQIAGNNQRFQERLNIAALQLNTAYALERLRIWRGFVLWGSVLLIPMAGLLLYSTFKAVGKLSGARRDAFQRRIALMKEETRQFEALDRGGRDDRKTD